MCKLSCILTVRQQGAFVDLIVDDIRPEDQTAVSLTVISARVRLVVEEIQRDSVSQTRHQGNVVVCLQI